MRRNIVAGGNKRWQKKIFARSTLQIKYVKVTAHACILISIISDKYINKHFASKPTYLMHAW
jgi:hypothetical protein